MPDHPHRPVAAVIPARGEEPFLSEAIESALAQPEVGEVFVATHEFDSPTAQLAAGYTDPRIRLVLSDGPSAGENLDAALIRTTAPWLAFLDADDRWPSGRVSIGLRAAEAIPTTQLVIGRQQAMDETGCVSSVIAPAPVLGAVLARREAVGRIGPFGNSMVAQMRWLLRALELGIPTLRLAEVTLFRRSHAGNLTRVQRPELHQAYLQLARERVARRRPTAGGP